MKKTYVITEINVGKNQIFLKSITAEGAEWVSNIEEALKFTNIEDAENEKNLLFESLMTKNKTQEYIKIIEF